MKILLATGLFPPEIGGPATHAALMQEELPRRGIEVDVVPFSLVRKMPRILRHFLYVRALVQRGRAADVLYALDPVSVGFPTLLASWILKKPYVLRVPGDYAWEQGVQRFGVRDTLDAFVMKRDYPIFVRSLRAIQSLVARRARHIIVPSEYLRGIVAMWGIERSRLTVAYSLPEHIPVVSKADARAKLSLEGPCIVAVGRLVPWKGFDTLIEALRDVRHAFPDATLRIVGSGPEMKRLSALANATGVAGSIFLEGNLSKEDMMLRVAAADVFALPTSYEGFSHQLIEVMRAGTPIVTTPVGGNRELIEDGVSGLFVLPGNPGELASALMKVLNEPRLGDRLVRGALQKVGTVGSDSSIDRIEEVLRSAARV